MLSTYFCVLQPYVLWPIRFCGSYGEASEPPKIPRKESFLTQCCSTTFVNSYIFSSQAKIETEISKFEQDIGISKFGKIEILHHLDEWKIAITSFILKIQDSNITCNPNFWRRSQRWKKGWSTGALLPEGNGQNWSWQKDVGQVYRTCRDFCKQGYLFNFYGCTK